MIGFVLAASICTFCHHMPTSYIYSLCYLQSYFLCLHAFISKSEANQSRVLPLPWSDVLTKRPAAATKRSNETGTISFQNSASAFTVIGIFQNPNTFKSKTSSGSLTPSSTKLLKISTSLESSSSTHLQSSLLYQLRRYPISPTKY